MGKGKWAFKDLLCLGVILLVSLLASLPLFKAEIVQFNDSFCAMVKTVGLAMVWQDGQVAGRWLPDINYGYGYPLLNFYPPLFSYLTAIASLIVNNYMVGTNIILILGFIGSGFAMYLFARDFWGRQGALLSAVAYVFAPFHLCDIYQRSADAQFLSFVFLPLSAWGFYRLWVDTRFAYFVWAALAFAGLIISHNAIALFFFPVMVAYVVFQYVTDPQKPLTKIACSAGAMVCAFTLTAYYWLPALAEKQYVMINKITQGNWDFHVHMMSLYQLLFAAWTYAHWGMGYGQSFQIGIGHLFLTVIALAVIPMLWRTDKKTSWHMLFWVVVGVACGFMMLKASAFVWESLPLVKYVAAPWRLIVLIAFVLSFLSGAIVFWKPGRAATWIVPCAIALILALNFSYAKPNATYALDLASPRAFLGSHWPMDNMEYLPRWVQKIPMAPPPARYMVMQGQAIISAPQKISGVHHAFTVNATTPAIVCFHHFYFPGWKVFIDGQETAIHPENPYGLIVFAVPPGVHDVRITFGHTPVRVAGELISWLTVLCLLGGGFFLGWRRRKI